MERKGGREREKRCRKGPKERAHVTTTPPPVHPTPSHERTKDVAKGCFGAPVGCCPLLTTLPSNTHTNSRRGAEVGEPGEAAAVNANAYIYLLPPFLVRAVPWGDWKRRRDGGRRSEREGGGMGKCWGQPKETRQPVYVRRRYALEVATDVNTSSLLARLDWGIGIVEGQ